MSEGDGAVTVRFARSDEDIARCFPVVRQLRGHLVEGEFVHTIRRQERGGYRLVYLESEGQIRSVAGFRVIDNLAGGRILYVDDLVTDGSERSRGFGGLLLDWLTDRARDAGCVNLELDSGVHRFDAHRFYFTKRMNISSYHFRLPL
jgi:GNAT superfamily N-acetyltransferase